MVESYSMSCDLSTCICIASGPSLTFDDCEIARQSGLFTIVVNSSWKAAPWADAIYAGDQAWWDNNKPETNAARYTSSCNIAQQISGDYIRSRPSGMSNSGADAIRLAQQLGYKRVLLIGYDCSINNGTHWHGDHESTKNPTPELVRGWHQQFAMLNDIDIEIINCSRTTALTCFPRADLEDAVCTSTSIIKRVK